MSQRARRNRSGRVGCRPIRSAVPLLAAFAAGTGAFVLQVLIPRVLAAHGTKDPRLAELAAVVRTFEEDMQDHMVREERVLFPWLRRLERKSEIHSGPPWSVRRPISCMVHDHDDAGAALARMRSLTDNFTPPPKACTTYRSMLRTLQELEQDTHVHVHKENEILFPAGIRAENLLPARARPQTEQRST